jgi:hypothetical protein
VKSAGGTPITRARTSTSASGLGELTRTRVTKQSSHGGDPEYVVVRLTDQALFQCPFVLMEDAGTAVFNDQGSEAVPRVLPEGRLRVRVGYWGPLAKDQFDQQIGRVLPRESNPIIDLPMDHPIWHTQFELKHLPQMSSIQSWRRTGGGTTERGVSPGTQSARAVVDAKGRIMVVMIHNDDIPRRLGARGRGEGIFPQLFARCLFRGHRRSPVCSDALMGGSEDPPLH